MLTLGGHSWPAELETLHSLIPGTTGAGKPTLIEELLDGVRARGERAIVCDPNGTYLSRFARDGDRLLNAFDARAEGWCVFNEIRADFDADRLAARSWRGQLVHDLASRYAGSVGPGDG